MRFLIFLTGLVFVSPIAQAADSTYLCQSESRKAILIVRSNGVHWSEEHDATSPGVFAGIETAPYIEWTGYKLYKLISFYSTEDAAYMIAVEPVTKGAQHLIAYVFFDNDDHEEDVAKYSCRASQLKLN